MKLALLSVFLALPLLLPAQTAKVIQLSPEDATKAAALYQQKADIEKQITDLEEKITESYLKGKADSYFCGVGYICVASPAPKSGWESGFEYSSDFKFIVPKPVSTSIGLYPICYPYGGLSWSGTGASREQYAITPITN